MREALPRISVDFNTAMQHPDSLVWIPTSVRPELLDVIAADARVILCDESLEVEATVQRLGPNEWWAMPDAATYRDLVPGDVGLVVGRGSE
ncbi:MAG TPA: hypothetical protein VMP03_13135 [Methylomirabilota bacterium]|nr:hypothetical protein [Methylomirabilota bacterium]